MERLNELLTGWWRVTSFHIEFADVGECANSYGVNPLGYIVFVGGRMMSILTSRERAGSDVVTLFESMMAYTGPYRVDGDGKVIRGGCCVAARMGGDSASALSHGRR